MPRVFGDSLPGELVPSSIILVLNSSVRNLRILLLPLDLGGETWHKGIADVPLGPIALLGRLKVGEDPVASSHVALRSKHDSRPPVVRWHGVPHGELNLVIVFA